MKGIIRLTTNSTGLSYPSLYYSLLALALLMGSSVCSEELNAMPKRWPGYAILGNGSICAVYSDDARLAPKSRLRGIRHFYYRDYTNDYIASTSFELLDKANNICKKDSTLIDSVGMANFFTTLSQSHLSDGILVESRAYAHQKDAIMLSFSAKGAPHTYSYRFRARLPKRMVTDRTVTMDHSGARGSWAVFSWSNGTTLVFGLHTGSGKAAIDDLGLVMDGRLENGSVVLIIAAGDSKKKALETLNAIQREKTPSASAAAHWEAWLNEGFVPEFGNDALLEAYRRNLYAAKASNLNGLIPADITGQFVTNNMPQLYPRDTLMCARVFLLTGHLEEARQILSFWTDSRIPMKSPGEWFARYDAHGQAVDAGSGARYDEPEWDSNGYLIQLAETYRQKVGQWPVDSSFLLKSADFLVDHINENGLLYEGGIVEWSGYLPATNMIAAAALRTAAEIAGSLGDSARKNLYGQASQTISASLDGMFDKERSTYADVHFAGSKSIDNRSLAQTSGEALYLWDTSANFGVLWGYPDHPRIQQSNAFYAQHCVKEAGAMQYFDAPDAGLAGYGHDLFFFTTSAAAQYQAKYGDPVRAKLHIDWMMNNANLYGLMPERIYLNGSGCSQASPLSWCCAEFAAALLEWQAARQ